MFYLCRSAVRGGRSHHGPVQTQTPASEVCDSGETGEDAAGSSGAHQTTRTGFKGAATA